MAQCEFVVIKCKLTDVSCLLNKKLIRFLFRIVVNAIKDFSLLVVI